jgi:hypothetical protein
VAGGVFRQVEDLVGVHLAPPPLVQKTGGLHQGPVRVQGLGKGHLAPLVQGLGQNLPLLFPQQGGQGLEDLGL